MSILFALARLLRIATTVVAANLEKNYEIPRTYQ